MTRKDFQMIAKILNRFHCKGHSVDQANMIEDMAKAMAHQMEQDNPRFDKHRFLDACCE